MPSNSTLPVELRNLGQWLSKARLRQRLTQKELAARSGVSQPRVCGIETGAMSPTLPQLIRLARALALPVQWFLTGSVLPGKELPDIALQLQWLGVVDLHVPEAVVPGAFRPTEQVLALAVSGNQPNPRIIEALPAVLAWNRWSASRLREYSRPKTSRACIRLAWLADVTLTIHRMNAFPGGCPQRKSLEAFVASLSKAKPTLAQDDLGRPGEDGALPPVSKRWKIRYAAPLSAFVKRASQLNSLLEQRRSTLGAPSRQSDE